MASTNDELSRNAGIAGTGKLFDNLEQRIVLSAIDNLPTLADLETGTEQSNPVVVLETTFGDIFLELFQEDAPNTVANFLEYVERGLYGESFFHRLAGGNSNPFALQGGGFAFDADGEIDFIFDEDLGTVNSEFGRANEARTIAMALSGGDTDSASSQFFINLIDNASGGAQLDQQGFTVFGRVITAASWNTVQAIVALGASDFSTDPSVATSLTDRFDEPLFRESNGDITFTDTGTPVTGVGAFSDLITLPTQDGDLDPNEVIEIENAQIVKPIDSEAFYTQQVAYPEGYASFSSREVLRLNNTNASDVDVQVIIRYEEGLRDEVVFSGTIPADEARQIVLHDAFDPNTDSLVRMATPYAVEVLTASEESVPVPVTAAVQRFDFGNGAGESFFNITDETARSDNWSFAAVPGSPGARAFVTFQNTGGSDQNVTVRVVGLPGGEVTEDFILGAYRRGGIDISSLPGAADLDPGSEVAVQVFTQSGDRVLVAAASGFGIFDTDTNGTGAPSPSPAPGVDQFATATLGVPSLSRVNTIAATFLPENGVTELSLFNPTNAIQIVQIQVATDGTPFTAIPAQILSPGEREVLDLNSFLESTVGTDTPFTLTYRSSAGLGAVGHITITADDGPGLRDVYASAVQNAAATELHFADSFFGQPTTDYLELLSIYNPYADQDLRYFVQYRFSDGEVISTAPTDIAASTRADIALDSVTDVASKIGGDDEFRVIGISVFGLGPTGDDDPFELVAALHRIDSRTGVLSQILSTGPTLLFDPVSLDDSRFIGGIGN